MRLRLLPFIAAAFLSGMPVHAQLVDPPCDPLAYYNTAGQDVVYRHIVPTPWFAVRMTADWVARVDTAFIGMGVDRAAGSGLKADTLEIRVLAHPLTPYYILDQVTMMVQPNFQGLVPDAMYLVEFNIPGAPAWIDPPDDFYLAWRIKGPPGDYARLLMTKPAANPLRSVIINSNNSTTLATDFMRSQLQLGTTDSVDFKTKTHVCWPYGYPVELTAFTGQLADGVVVLEWHTASETNNSGFAVERMAATSEQGMVRIWQRIGFVEGHGSTTQAQRYTFLDPAPAVGTDEYGNAHYRLRQIDYNGRTELSPEVQVSIPHNPTLVFEDVYPNPLPGGSGKVSIAFSLPTSQAVQVELSDALGRTVAIAADAIFPAGRSVLEIPVTGLRGGMYFCRVRANGETRVRRLSIVE